MSAAKRCFERNEIIIIVFVIKMGQGKSKGSANVAPDSDVASVTTAGSVSDLSGKKRRKWRRGKAGYSMPDDRSGSSLTLNGGMAESHEAVLVSYRDKKTRLCPPQRTQSMALPQNLQPALRPSSEERSLRPRRAPSAAAAEHRE